MSSSPHSPPPSLRELSPRAILFVASALALFAPALPAQQCTSKTYGTASLFKAGSRLVDGDADVLFPKVSSNGRMKVFHSDATNYEGDSVGVTDVFYSRNSSARNYRVSVGLAGVDANGDSFLADVSGDGEWIAFTSFASNLVPGDTNGQADVFLYEVASATITRISVGVGGAESNGPSSRPAVSKDGRFVAFQSAASNLVPTDANGKTDVFRYDRSTGTILLVSVDSSGNQGDDDSSEAAIDGAGDIVAFQSRATNLGSGADGNGVRDVFVHRMSTGNTIRVSDAAGGGDANGPSFDPELSEDGKSLSYTSDATDLLPGGADSNGKSDVYLEHLTLNLRQRVSVAAGDVQANGDSGNSSVSNVPSVVFQSDATNLVGADQNGVADVFVRDPGADRTFRASIDSDDVEADDVSRTPDITSTGCDVVFASSAKNLIAQRPAEGNAVFDLFCHRHQGAWPIFCIEPELQDINQPVQVRSTSGPPLGALVLFVTHLNDIPFFFLYGIAHYDSTGNWVLNTSVPNDPTLLGLVPSFVGFAFPAGGGPPKATNAHFLGIQN